MNQLTKGSIAALMRNEVVEQPIVQILEFKKVFEKGLNQTYRLKNYRYRLMISDSINSYINVMMSLTLKHLIENGDADRLSIVRLDGIVSSVVDEKLVLIVTDMIVIEKGSNVNLVIGKPILWVRESCTRGIVEVQANPQILAATTVQDDAQKLLKSVGNMLISDINPVISQSTKLQASVTYKSGIRNWSTGKGKGEFFNFHLMDESGSIKMTGFNSHVPLFYPIVKEGDSYLISKFTVKEADPRYSSLNHKYELIITTTTEIIPCTIQSTPEEDVTFELNVKKIKEMKYLETGTVIDVLGICIHNGVITKFKSKTNSSMMAKKNILLIDDSDYEIVVILWGQEAEQFQPEGNPVVLIKGAKVTDYTGKSLSMTSSSKLTINPQIRQGQLLQEWHRIRLENIPTRLSKAVPSKRVGTPWKTLKEINSLDDGIATGSKKIYFARVKVTVSNIKIDNILYKGCPEPNCDKKLTENEMVDNQAALYRCENCKLDMPEFSWKMLLNIDVLDETACIPAVCFNTVAETLIGMTAQDLGMLREQNYQQFNIIVMETMSKQFFAVFKSQLQINETVSDDARQGPRGTKVAGEYNLVRIDQQNDCSWNHVIEDILY